MDIENILYKTERVLKLRNYSPKTRKTYLLYIKEYIRFSKNANYKLMISFGYACGLRVMIKNLFNKTFLIHETVPNSQKSYTSKTVLNKKSHKKNNLIGCNGGR